MPLFSNENASLQQTSGDENIFWLPKQQIAEIEKLLPIHYLPYIYILKKNKVPFEIISQLLRSSILSLSELTFLDKSKQNCRVLFFIQRQENV